MPSPNFTPLVNAFTYAATAAFLLTDETRIINPCLAFGLATFTLGVIKDCALFRDSGYLLILLTEPLNPIRDAPAQLPAGSGGRGG